MIDKNKESQSYQTTIEKAVMKIKQKGYDQVKADCEGFDVPAQLVNQANEHAYVPDITAYRDGRKSYFEIAQKSDPERLLVSKWKLLESLAAARGGIFQIFIPKGHIKFTQEFISRHNINAELERI